MAPDPKISEEFVVSTGKKYSLQLGKRIAASLPGFIAGFVVGLIVFLPLIVWLFIELYNRKSELAACLGGL